VRNGNAWQAPSSKEAEELLKGLRTEEGESFIGRASRLLGMENGRKSSRLLGMENGRKRIMNILNGNTKMNRAEYKYFNDIVNGEQ
jgi:hypothetical protein